MKKIITVGVIKDISIQSTSLENIIYDIYTSKKENG